MKHHWIVNDDQLSLTHFRQNSPKNGVILLGAPDDRGVYNVGGRLGAGDAPDAIRQMFENFMLGLNPKISQLEVFKGYNIAIQETIAATHQELRKAVALELKTGRIPLVLGGGHDYGYPHLAGVFDVYGENLALINIDAHLDMRPVVNGLITSGSPFYMALENKIINGKYLYEFGIQIHCNDNSHYQYALKNNVNVLTLNELRVTSDGPYQAFAKLLQRLSKAKKKIVLSVDIDALQMAYAPGVSAPQTDGFRVDEFLRMILLAGKTPDVVSIGFFEMAPLLDEGQKTSRLVATAIYNFLNGVTYRDETAKSSRLKRVRRLLKSE